MTEDFYVDELGYIVCVLDGSRFVSKTDFIAHKGSFRHRKRFVVVDETKPRKVNVREKIFNY